MRSFSMKAATLAIAILAIHSAAPNQSHAQYNGASGNNYNQPYWELDAAGKADVDKFREMWGLRSLKNDPIPPWVEKKAITKPSSVSVSPTSAMPPPDTFSPTAGWKPAPTLQEVAGQFSTKAERSTKELAASVEGYRKTVSEAIARHEKAPALDSFNESERIELLLKLLRDTVELGNQVDLDKRKLVTVFGNYKRTGEEAAKYFRQAESFFSKSATEETDTVSKNLYLKSAKLYASRAARCELQAQRVIPTDISTEMTNLEKRVKACKNLLSFVERDPFLLKNEADTAIEFREFYKAFASVGVTLDSWTSKILEDLEPVEDDKKKAK